MIVLTACEGRQRNAGQTEKLYSTVITTTPRGLLYSVLMSYERDPKVYILELELNDGREPRPLLTVT